MFILAIYSIAMVVSAYEQLSAATQDVEGIINNWQTMPVVEVSLISANSNCLSGWEIAGDGSAYWSGAEMGNCACHSNAYVSGDGDQHSSSSSCDTNQTKGGCKQDPSIGGVDLWVWGGMKTCLRRGGEATGTWDDLTGEYQIRPKPDLTTFACPEGYKKCGADGTYNDLLSICFPADELCPLTNMQAAASAPTGYNEADRTDEYYTTADGQQLYLYFKREGSGELPLVDFEADITDTIVLDSTTDTRGPCKMGSERYSGVSTYSVTSGTSVSSVGRQNYDDACETRDTRYSAWMKLEERDVLEENFKEETRCSAWDGETAIDYRNGGADCRTAETGVGACTVSLSTGQCRASDVICDDVTGQSECGQLVHFANEADKVWGQYARNEIMWEEGCGVDHDQLKKQKDPLRTATDLQHTLMIVNIAVNVVGIIFIICIVWNRFSASKDVPCCPGEGLYEKKMIDMNKKWLGHSLRIVKMIPLFICIGLTAAMKDFFAELANHDCSDELTDDSFDFLGETIPSVHQKNVMTLVADMAQLFVGVAQCYVDRKNSDKEGATIAPAEQQTAAPQQTAMVAPAVSQPSTNTCQFCGMAGTAAYVTQTGPQHQPTCPRYAATLGAPAVNPQQPVMMAAPAVNPQQPVMMAAPAVNPQQPVMMAAPPMMQQQPVMMAAPPMVQQQPVMMAAPPMIRP